MLRLAAFLTKNLAYSIFCMMVVGFLYGYVGQPGWLKSLILPLTFLMVFPMMINIKLDKVFSGGDIKLQLMTASLNFILIPMIALGLGTLMFKDQPYLVLGLFLVSLLPTSGMTISYTGLCHGNLESAIKMTVIGLVGGSLLAPFYLDTVLGAKINIDMVNVMQTIGLIVFLPMIAGVFTQRIMMKRVGKQEFFKQIGSRYGPLSTFGVTGVIFVAAALKAKSIVADVSILPSILIPLLIFYTINYAISIVIGKLMLSRDDGIALLFGSVMRNLSIALAVIMNAFGEDGSTAALLVSLGLIVQVQSAAWFVKFIDKIYGPKTQSKAVA